MHRRIALTRLEIVRFQHLFCTFLHCQAPMPLLYSFAFAEGRALFRLAPLHKLSPRCIFGRMSLRHSRCSPSKSELGALSMRLCSVHLGRDVLYPFGFGLSYTPLVCTYPVKKDKTDKTCGNGLQCMFCNTDCKLVAIAS